MLWIRNGCILFCNNSKFSIALECLLYVSFHLGYRQQSAKKTISKHMRWSNVTSHSLLVGNTHCVLLKHYYSVDFPWWFDRKISFFSLLRKTWKLEKKSCQMTICKSAICDLTEKLLPSNFVVFKSIWRPNAWMDTLEISFLLN